MPTSLFILGIYTFALATCLFAFLKGGPAERIATLLIVANMAVWAAGETFLPHSMVGVALMTNDAITALGLLIITLRYGTPWLGLAMLLYAAQFALHAFYFVMERPANDLFHARVNNLNFVGILVCLALGTVQALRRRAQPA